MPLFGRETQQSQQRAQEYARWVRERNPFAIVSLLLGVFSLVEFGALVIFGVASIVLGIIALKQLSGENPQQPRGHRLAWSGMILSAVSLVCAAVLYLHPTFK
jgi:ABC-type branched-subunit amino acid transport system permease subunit